MSSFDFRSRSLTGYSYDFNYRTGSALNADVETDIVIYDVLEEVPSSIGKTSSWKGTFESINTSQVAISETKPIVYYPTQMLDFSLYENKDLSDASKWSTVLPSDKSSVKSISVDCRKKTDGTDFVLDTWK